MGKDKKRYSFVQLDVFASRPFEGNSLAVFPDARGLSDEEKKEEAGALPPGSTQATLTELEKGLSAARPGDHHN